MLYNEVPQTFDITVENVRERMDFRATRFLRDTTFALGFGKEVVYQDKSADGQVVPEDRAVLARGLVTCAAVVYVYVGAGAVVRNVAVVHAHTGYIDAKDLPTVPRYNVHGIAPANIHVVFAASAPREPDLQGRSVRDGAQGLIDIVNDGVRRDNIRVITDIGFSFGSNALGEIGTPSTHRFWHDDLRTPLLQVLESALADYLVQFGARRTKGFLGMGHNAEDGRRRIHVLSNQVRNAAFDDERLDALERFFQDTSRSYKAGSLKLAVLSRFVRRFKPPPVPLVTTANASEVARSLIGAFRTGLV